MYSKASWGGRGGWASFRKLVCTNIKTWLTKWLLQKSENPLDKVGFGLDGSGPFCAEYSGLNRLNRLKQ
jgi:hypothetical protein